MQRDYYCKDTACIYYDASTENMHCLETMNINTAFVSPGSKCVCQSIFTFCSYYDQFHVEIQVQLMNGD